MKTIVNFVLPFSFILTSCSSDQSTNPEPSVIAKSMAVTPVFTQVAGCQQSVTDSTLVYEFIKDLKVWFVVRGNCCPDSNRFVLSCQLKADTIFAFPVDTAARLCRCLCPYVLYAEFKDLAVDRYVFVCKDEDLVLYNKTVTRTR